MVTSLRRWCVLEGFLPRVGLGEGRAVLSGRDVLGDPVAMLGALYVHWDVYF